MSNKPKVATKPMKAKAREGKILNYLKEYPEGAYPKIIAFYTGIKHNTAKSILRKLKREGKIKIHPENRGMYLLVEKNGDIPVFNFQNTILLHEADNLESDKTITISNSLNNAMKYRIVIGAKTKRICMYISSDYPYSVPSLFFAADIFQRVIKDFTGMKPGFNQIWVKQIELNTDYIKYRLDGIQCVTLDTLCSQYKLYNKENFLREEYRLKIPFTADFFGRMIRGGSIATEVIALSERHSKKLDSVDKDMRKLDMKIEAILRLLGRNKECN